MYMFFQDLQVRRLERHKVNLGFFQYCLFLSGYFISSFTLFLLFFNFFFDEYLTFCLVRTRVRAYRSLRPSFVETSKAATDVKDVNVS